MVCAATSKVQIQICGLCVCGPLICLLFYMWGHCSPHRSIHVALNIFHVYKKSPPKLTHCPKGLIAQHSFNSFARRFFRNATTPLYNARSCCCVLHHQDSRMILSQSCDLKLQKTSQNTHYSSLRMVKWTQTNPWIKHHSEHLHPAAERHALEMPFEGLQACNQIF